MERVRGIEPLSSAWKADIISHYTIPAFIKLVGVRGLEPPTSSSQTTRASQLRHTPRKIHYVHLAARRKLARHVILR